LFVLDPETSAPANYLPDLPLQSIPLDPERL
jgi:hypothetical protein